MTMLTAVTGNELCYSISGSTKRSQPKHKCKSSPQSFVPSGPPWVIFLTQSSKGSCKGSCIYNAHKWHWQFNLTHGLRKPNSSNPKSCISWHHQQVQQSACCTSKVHSATSFDVQYMSLVLSDLETYSHQELFKDTLKHLLSPEGDANIIDTSMKVCEVWCVKIYGH